jgi:hypothetical protein
MVKTRYRNLSGQICEGLNTLNKLSYITETMFFCIGYLKQDQS